MLNETQGAVGQKFPRQLYNPQCGDNHMRIRECFAAASFFFLEVFRDIVDAACLLRSASCALLLRMPTIVLCAHPDMSASPSHTRASSPG